MSLALLRQADWITTSSDTGDVCPVFRTTLSPDRPVKAASLTLSALGVYEARLNGLRVGDFVLAPGWTSYDHRLQVQTYDILPLLHSGDNELRVTVGRGWFRSPIPGWIDSEDKRRRLAQPCGLIAMLSLTYADGSSALFPTGPAWQWAESPVRFSEIYDGEHVDATVEPSEWAAVSVLDWSRDILIPQEGEIIREQDRIAAQRVFVTPRGETVVDFGQEVTGYVEFSLTAHAGDEIHILHGEVLDRDGNFYNDNYRGAKAEIRYVCREGGQTWHPVLTFFGFRYLKLDKWPGKAQPSQFTAIAVFSDLRQTGSLVCGVKDLNRLFSNIFWGQKGNFLDVPTDCPQRDERLGWTGDAQVFCKAAAYNYDVERFFRKWLHDLRCDQRPSGEVVQVIPDVMPTDGGGSSAWGDAATIIPWQVYMTYGDPQVLLDQFDSMKAWVDFITASTTTKGLWTGHFHFGDWLGLDAPAGSYEGSTRKDFIASAFYIHSARLLIQAGHVIGRNVESYEALLPDLVSAFRAAFPTCLTQTEHILALHFDLAPDPQSTADALADMIRRDGTQMRTGFVGTPYLLHVLSRYGYTPLAYDLLLRRAYPSWLYPLSKGATTIWEHWDGIMENGDFWSRDMNSFNHYAYGSVADWVYERAAGIRPLTPGFGRVLVEPEVDSRLGFLDVSLQTRHGLVRSRWTCLEDGSVRYEITCEMPAVIRIAGQTYNVSAPGRSIYWSRS